jgi:hypothetical protein
MIITYEQVFGVPLGQEVQETHGVNWTPCPAVTSLRQQLMFFPFFGGAKVGGVGPLYIKGPNTHEFNRHHAGLAVDIMLAPNRDTEVALGHQLVLLFKQHADVMKWHGLIYQDVTIDLVGASRRPQAYSKGDHDDHIHIDWHSSRNVQWRRGIREVPLRLRDGVTVITMVPKDAVNGIAESITWTPEATTVFGVGTDPTLHQRLRDLIDRLDQGTLEKVDLAHELSLTAPPRPSFIKNELRGTWSVTIGSWNGLFVFNDSTVYWADDNGSPHHNGKWWVTQSEVLWKFQDSGDIRTFTVSLPLYRSSIRGMILPAGQGFFAMEKIG